MNNKVNDEIAWKEIVKLFRKANQVHQWGEFANIKLYDDGTGDVRDSDYDIIFSFHDLYDLVNKLRG